MDISRVVNFTFSFKHLGISISPGQIRVEILKLLKIIEELKPKFVLEIGTANGGTLFLFARVAEPEAIIISVDLPGGPFGGGYPKWKIPLYRAFTQDKQKLYLIRADSHDVNTLRKVEDILSGCEIDSLFIDGDHTYEGVKEDFEMYAPLVRKGGIIAFHDIVPHTLKTKCEVSRFWNKIKKNYRYLEIVRDWDQKWGGIGILYM